MKKEMVINYKMKKKGVSAIVASVVMIALVIAIAGVVWVVISNLVSEQLSDAGTCLDVLGKVKINHEYTCYNSSSQELLISIGISDIEIEKIIVSVSGSGSSKSYEIGKTDEESSAELRTYTGGDVVVLPGQNAGLTYRLNTGTEGLGKPDSFRIFPVLGGKQCDEADSVSGISSCLLLA